MIGVLRSLTELVVHSVEAHGVVAVLVLMLLESACVPVPAEVTMLVAGMLVVNHSASFPAMVVAGVLGNVVRSFISLPAGMARMPVVSFAVVTILGCVPFVVGFTWLGMLLGDRWTSIHHSLDRVNYAIVATVALAAAVLVLRRRMRQRRRIEIGSIAQ